MLTWEDVVQGKNFGDIELQQDGEVYRGGHRTFAL